MKITPASLFRFLVNRITIIKSFFIYRDVFIIFKAHPRPLPKTKSSLLHKITNPKKIHDIYINLERNFSSLDTIIVSRIKHGYTFFALYEKDKIICTTWISNHQPRFIDEIAISVDLEDKSIWIRDSFCIPEHRGSRFFSKIIALIIEEYYPDTTHIYSDTVISNRSSIRAHKCYGFEKQFNIHYTIIFKKFLIRKADKSNLHLNIFQKNKAIVTIDNNFKRYVADHLA